MPAIRVVLPYHLYTLAHCGAEVALDVAPPVTLAAVLDALEAVHPDLAGLVRERATGKRRPLIRFFAVGHDLSNLDPAVALPEAVATGREPLLVVGAIAGG